MTYSFFRILAWSDLLGLLFCTSFISQILQPATPVFATAYWYAHFESFFTNVPMSISVLTVVCITIDRFFSVCRPIQFKKIHTKKYARIGIGISVLIASVIWFPTCFIKRVKETTDCESFNSDRLPDGNQTYYVACMTKNILGSPGYLAYSWIRQTVVSFIPILILLILNYTIIRNYMGVVKRREQMRGQGPNTNISSLRPNELQQAKEDQNLIRMLYAIMITFFITMLPPGIANAMYTKFLSTELQYEIFRAVANDLEILNHAMNFYIYMIFSKPLRNAIKDYFLKKKDRFKFIRKSRKGDKNRESNTDNKHESPSKNFVVTNPENVHKVDTNRPVSNISTLMDSSEYNLSQTPSPEVSSQMAADDTIQVSKESRSAELREHVEGVQVGSWASHGEGTLSFRDSDGGYINPIIVISSPLD